MLTTAARQQYDNSVMATTMKVVQTTIVNNGGDGGPGCGNDCVELSGFARARMPIEGSPQFR